MKRLSLLLAAAALGAAAALVTTARPTHAQSFGAQKLKWERIEADLEAPPRNFPMIESDRQRLIDRMNVYRTKVPGGWLVMQPRGGMTLVPDPQHTWDGGSLPR